MMPACSNSVATPIVDKNGRATTVHRRAAAQPDTKVCLPAPVASSKTSKLSSEDALKNTLIRLHKAGFIKTRNGDNLPITMAANIKHLALADPDVLVEVTDHILAADEPERRCWESALTSTIICHEDPSESAKYRTAYRTRMAFQPVVTKIAAKHPMYTVTSVSGDILAQAEDAAHDVGSKDIAYFKAAVIYVGLTILAEDRPDMTVRQNKKSRETIRFIAERVDEVELLLDELIARRTVDPVVIEQLLDSPSALTSGTL